MQVYCRKNNLFSSIPNSITFKLLFRFKYLVHHILYLQWNTVIQLFKLIEFISIIGYQLVFLIFLFQTGQTLAQRDCFKNKLISKNQYAKSFVVSNNIIIRHNTKQYSEITPVSLLYFVKKPKILRERFKTREKKEVCKTQFKYLNLKKVGAVWARHSTNNIEQLAAI